MKPPRTADGARSRDGGARAPLAWGLLLLAVAAALRLWRISADGLWVDEAYTAWLAQLPLREVFAALRADDAPALFYLCERAVVRLLGDSEAALRIFPAACGLGTVGLAWAFARRCAPRAALFAALALGLSTLLVFYSRQARSYSLLHLLGTALLWASLSLRREPGRRHAIAFAAAALGLLYSHNLGLLLVGCGALFVGGELRRPERRSELLALFGLLAAGSIPWTLRLIDQLGVHSEWNRWMAAWWDQGRPLVLAPLYSWALFANGAAPGLHPPIPLPGLEGDAAWGRALGWTVVLAGIAGFVRHQRQTARRDAGRALLLFAALPLVGLVLVSLVAGPAYVLGRTDTLALPAYLLLLAFGWSALPRAAGWSAAGIWAILALGSLLPLGSDAGRIAKGSDRALAADLSRQARPGDALVYAALTRPTAEYYARRQGWGGRLTWAGSFPQALDRNPAAPIATPVDSAGAWREEALRLRARWEREGVRRVWILALRDPRAGADGRAWPRRPSPPRPGRETVDATSVAYPMNVLVAALAGLREVPVQREYRQDWVSGDRWLLRVDRDRWVPVDSVPAVEAAR